MKEKEESKIKLIIGAFVLVILAVAFLSAIATQSSTNTEKTYTVDEAYNLSTSCYTSGQVNTSKSGCAYTVIYEPTGWEVDDCPLTNVVVTNNTGTELVLDTDYELTASTGVITFLNTTSTNATNLGAGGVAKLDYGYCGEGYVNSSWGRDILKVTVGLFAIAILVIVIILVTRLLDRKDED